MRVVCIKTFDDDDFDASIRALDNVVVPHKDQIFHVTRAKDFINAGWEGKSSGLFYKLAEATPTIWYDAVHFRRVTDISDLQKLTVIKTKTKEMEDA